MSVKIPGERGKDWKLNDMLRVNPENVVVTESLRGRHFAPSEREILNLALSLNKYGQIAPCEVRLQDIVSDKANQKNVPVSNSGFTRCEAARRLRKGFVIPEDWTDTELVVPEEGVEVKARIYIPCETIQDPNFMLSCVYINCNGDKAFLRNIEENLCRTDTGDMNDAYNQETLRQKYGYSDADIARLYKYANQSRVTRLKRLLNLPDKIQLLVHEGRLPTNGAIDLLDSPQDKWEQILIDSTGSDGKVSGAKVRTGVRNTQIHPAEGSSELVIPDSALLTDFNTEQEMHEGLADHPAGAPGTPVAPTPRAKPRSLADMRKFIGQRTKGDKQEWEVEPAIATFLKTLGLWLAGKRTDASLDNALETLLSEETTGKTTAEAA